MSDKRSKPPTTRGANPFDEHLIYEARKIAMSLGRMFAPFCEVLLHDLRTPDASIVAIENPLSGRKLGDSATNLGLARITQPDFPDVIQNYANTFADGRRVKSTSIGIRGQSGQFIASICLNLDTTHFVDFTALMTKFVAATSEASPIVEQTRSHSLDEIRATIAEFSAKRDVAPEKMQSKDRRELIGILKARGLMELKNAKSFVASALGITRPSVYNYLGGKAA